MIKRLAQAKARRARRSGEATTGHALTPAPLTNPADYELNSRMEECVLTLRDVSKCPNSIKALDTKQEEYMQYCEVCYPDDPYKWTLDREKAYRFMWYQTFREQKPRGGNRRFIQSNTFFDKDDYDRVKNLAVEVAGNPEPQRPIGRSVFTQYKDMMRSLYKYQTARRVINMHWDGIWTEKFDDLEKHVKERTPRKKKESYEEKATSEFAPYAVAERYHEIEESLWTSGYGRVRRSTHTALRHRFCFLYLTSGLLRSESLYRAELSDFLSLTVPKKDKDVYPMFLMINSIPIGKTTHGSVQYGRATRHKNVNLCAIGSMSMYLNFRFYNTREFHEFTLEDWLDRKVWFDIKLLTDLTGGNDTVMTNDSYSDKLRAILLELGLPSCDLLHLGRKLGSKLLDLSEEQAREIQRMGQWADGVWDRSYSSKLPFGPMRKLAGYLNSSEFYFNTRTIIDPPESLLELTPMGEWCYDAYAAVRAEATRTGLHGTAVQVLRFFCELNKVFLQDAAATLALYPARSCHPVFQLPVFSNPAFKDYTEVMAAAILHESNPMDADLEKVLPGVHRWHQANQISIDGVSTQVQGMVTDVKESKEAVQALKQELREQRQESDQRLANTFLSIARELLAGTNKSCGRVSEEFFIGGAPEKEDLLLTPEREAPPITDDRPDHPDHLAYNMRPRHITLADMWDEWHGEGQFYDRHGGIKGREAKHKSNWRKHIDGQHLSRTKQCIFAIKVYADANKLPVKHALAALQDLYVEVGKSVSNLCRRFKTMGILEKKKPRGKHAQKES